MAACVSSLLLCNFRRCRSIYSSDPSKTILLLSATVNCSGVRSIAACKLRNVLAKSGASSSAEKFEEDEYPVRKKVTSIISKFQNGAFANIPFVPGHKHGSFFNCLSRQMHWSTPLAMHPRGPRKTILGLDIGSSSIGVSVTRPHNMSAIKLNDTIRWVDLGSVIEELHCLMRDYDADCMVIGFPVYATPNGTFQNSLVEEFIRHVQGHPLGKRYLENTEYTFWDEAYTTKLCDHLQAPVWKGQNIKQGVDEIPIDAMDPNTLWKRKCETDNSVAYLLLQTYVDYVQGLARTQSLDKYYRAAMRNPELYKEQQFEDIWTNDIKAFRRRYIKYTSFTPDRPQPIPSFLPHHPHPSS